MALNVPGKKIPKKLTSYRMSPISESSPLPRKNSKLYDYYVEADNELSTVDTDYNSEIKHDWRTKYFQYGKMFKSLEQNIVMQDYYSKFVPLYSRAVTPKQMEDYF